MQKPGPVPIPINRNVTEIGAVQITVNEKKFKTRTAVVWMVMFLPIG